MQIASNVSAQKLRGGFYSPAMLVKVSLDRVAALTRGREALRVLEPTAGDGAFLRGLEAHTLRGRIGSVTAIELLDVESAKCASVLESARFSGIVRNASFLDSHNLLGSEQFDLAVGNPPFLRYQFIEKDERASVEALAERLGITFKGVSNLWIPILIGALSKIVKGGAFAFIVPFECLTGISAKVLRDWLLDNVAKLKIDLFPVGSFPGVLQEVVILSGRMDFLKPKTRTISLYDHDKNGKWEHRISERPSTWTGLLLTPKQLEAWNIATKMPGTYALGTIARIGVATVTGANDFFSITEATVNEFQLDSWSRPLVSRIRQVSGLAFTEADFVINRESGCPVWLFDAGLGKTDPKDHEKPRQYIEKGEADDLQHRYKCRIRTPWYRVPVVKPRGLLLSKRSHRYPRMVENLVGAVTTDTIYQGSLNGAFVGRERDVVGSFHNSLTLLSAEIYGRSFGGGVLELVPSEVSSLVLPLVSMANGQFDILDSLARTQGFDSEALVDETDKIIGKVLPGYSGEVLNTIKESRGALLRRRLDRN